MRFSSVATMSGRAVLVISLALSCFSSTAANAQTVPTPPKACSEMMTSIVKEAVAASNFANLQNSGAIVCFWELALPRLSLSSSLRAQAAAQKNAATIQTGAPTGSNGTTSAVSKPFTPLSLATEYGGVTSSTTNQTMTWQTTLDAVPAAFTTHGFVGYCWSPIVIIPSCITASHLGWLNRFGVGVTANTATSAQSVAGTASPSQTTAQMASLKTAGATSPSLASAFGKWTILRGKYQPGKQTLTQRGRAVNDAQEKLNLAVRELKNAGIEIDSWSQCVSAQFISDRLPNVAAQSEQFAKYWVQLVDVVFASGSVNCEVNAPILPEKHVDDLRPTTAKREEWEKLVAVVPPSDQTSPAYKTYELTKGRLDLVDAVDGYLAAVSLFESQADQLLRASAPVLSLEYDYNTPVSQPTTSTAKLLFSYSGWKEQCTNRKGNNNGTAPATSLNRLTATLNAGGNFYNSAPSAVPGAGAFRDTQLGSELDFAVCTSSPRPVWSLLGNATFGITYYYQDQVSPSILKVTPGEPVSGISIIGLASSTSQVFAKKGPINFVQLKYGLGTGKNVKFPIAVSWSNRTDLITHSLWSAQFGVSYDFSSLLNSSSSASTADGGGGSRASQ
jgi:hypothetical protein